MSELFPSWPIRLETAFDTFLVDPLKNDKLCRAKLAIVQTLDKLEHRKRDIFEKAARHVQLEPAFGGKVDTAAPCAAQASLLWRESVVLSTILYL